MSCQKWASLALYYGMYRQELNNLIDVFISLLNVFSDGDNILLNEQVGHMMRTKLTSCNEGGVHAGDGVLDSPFLIDDYLKLWLMECFKII